VIGYSYERSYAIGVVESEFMTRRKGGSEMTIRRVCAAAMVFGVLVLTGCGSDGGDGSSVGSDPGAIGVEETARAGNEAVFSGDYSVLRSLLTDECQEEHGVGEIAAQVSVGVAVFVGFMGMEVEDLERLEVGDVIVDEIVEGETATVRNSLLLDGELFTAMEEPGEGVEYVYQGGRWRSTDCDFE